MNAMNKTGRTWNKGDIVRFGNYQIASGIKEPLAWKVLEVTEDDLLLITRDSVMWAPYYHCYGGNVEWEKTTLCESLNKYFLSTAFSDMERSFLKPFANEQLVTILSKAEAEKYMPDPAERKAYSTPTANDQAADYRASFYGVEQAYEDPKEELEKLNRGEGQITSWWIRDGLKEGDLTAAFVCSDGGFAATREHIHPDGVRPCIRLSLRKSWNIMNEGGLLSIREAQENS